MSAATTILLEVRRATVRRSGRTLLDAVSCGLRPGQLTVLLGPNGAGKTTLFRLLAGEWEPTSGEVAFAGKPLPWWDRRELARRRAVTPQHSSLNFPFRVEEVVAMGRLPFAGRPEARNDREAVAAAIAAAEIEPFVGRLYPTLSGGEKQRVHFARTLAQVHGEPADSCVLLLDEPTSSLDWPHQQVLLETLRERAQKGSAVLVILHDLNLAMAYADEVWLMRNGAMRVQGPPGEALTAESVRAVFGVELHQWREPGLERPLLALAPRTGGGCG